MYKQKDSRLKEEYSMNRFTFSYPTKVYFGEGSAAQDFRTELRKKGKTVLLAYGGGKVRPLPVSSM